MDYHVLNDVEESFISHTMKEEPKYSEVFEVKLETKDLNFSVEDGDETIEILKGITSQFYPGSLLALMGPSGAGKTTLLNVLGGYLANGDISGFLADFCFPKMS